MERFLFFLYGSFDEYEAVSRFHQALLISRDILHTFALKMETFSSF